MPTLPGEWSGGEFSVKRRMNLEYSGLPVRCCRNVTEVL